MNEINILQVLYKNRFRLLAVSAAIGIVVAAVSLLFSNKYSSTAAISVQRPEVPITGEVSPLQVEALRSLTESTRVKRELYNRLRDRGRLEEGVGFRSFQRMLSTRVQHVEGRERTLLPLVKLTATTSDQALSAEIANQWAEVVLSETRKIYQSGVDELSTFTVSMYEEVSQSLLESEDRFAEIKLEANLDGNKLALSHNQKVYSRLLERALELEDQAATGEAIARQIAARLAEQEVDGVWIGEVFPRHGDPEREFTLPDATPLTDRVLETIRSLARNEEALAEFEKTSRIESKQARARVLKLQIDEISGEILQARGELSSVEPAYRSLAEQLKELKPTITLKKALGDELLMVLPERGRPGEEFPKMESEISNPIYEEIKGETIRLSAQVDGLRNKIAQGGERLEELKSEVSDLNREIVSLAARQRVYQAAIERDRELLDYYALSYREDRREYEKLRKELEQGSAELAAKKNSREQLAEKISGLEEKVYAAENALARQKRDLENLSQVRSSLASRAEELALLKVSMENVSRSGTVLLYGAGEDPVKVAPNRGRIVLISIFLAFLVYSLILVLGEAVRQTKPSPAAEAG